MEQENQNPEKSSPKKEDGTENNQYMGYTFFTLGFTWLILGFAIKDLSTVYLILGITFISIGSAYIPWSSFNAKKTSSKNPADSETDTPPEPEK